MKKIISIFILLSCYFCTPALANDTAGYVLPTGGIVFEKQDGIQMQVEALYIRPEQIEVNYIFKNTTDKDITTQVFFPLPPISAVLDFYRYYQDAEHHFNFNLWINGEKTNYQTHFTLEQDEREVPAVALQLWKTPEETLDFKQFHERVSAMPEADRQTLVEGNYLKWGWMFVKNPQTNEWEEGEGWAIEDGDDKMWQKLISYSWVQTFPARKTVHIRHTYTPSSKTTNTGMPFSSCINPNTWDYQDFVRIPTPPGTNHLWDKLDAQDYVEYILTTANNWQGPIENFNLLVESPLKSVGCFDGEAFYGGPYFAVNRQKYTPEWDISVDFIAKGRIARPYHPKSEPALYRVDGPANVRNKPNGKVIGQMENDSYVWVWPKDKKGKWYPVLQNDLQGYTHKQNLIKVF